MSKYMSIVESVVGPVLWGPCAPYTEKIAEKTQAFKHYNRIKHAKHHIYIVLELR